MRTLPGTALALVEGQKNSYQERIRPMIAATGGLMLSQVEAITGIPASTIQNWIKRGWVAQTESKRYNQRQLYRIIIINLLHGCMAMEQINDIMAYVNGDVDDASDDIIDDGDLLEYLYEIILELNCLKTTDHSKITQVILNATSDYKGAKLNKIKLERALTLMTTAYISAQMRDNANKMYNEIIKEIY